ncbi:MAG: N-acyl homoserine lactonase family protein [Burkholderiales bacterium]
MRIYALACGTLEFDRSLFFPAAEPGTKLVTPVSSYLIVHPRGNVLFDTGIHCDALADPVARLGRRVAGLFAIRSAPGDDVVSQLAGLGVRPDDVQTVVNSHFHFDHCGCNMSFPRATFLVQRAELDVARAERNRYNPKDWDHPLDYQPIDGEHDVFGDGAVVLLPTPGHTPGHQSLWIRDGAGRQLVLTADASYTREHLDRTILPHAVHDAAEMTRSLGVLRELRDRRGVDLLYGHDPEQWNSIPHAPQALI